MTTVTAAARYTRAELTETLRGLGLGHGDIVFVQGDLDALGDLAGALGAERDAAVADALRSVVGDEGTIVVPSYTFSFCRGETYDPHATPTKGGPWSPAARFLEHVRRRPGAVRSADPIHSVVAWGPQAAALVDRLPPTCFGADSVFERLIRWDARLCMLGLDWDESTVRHHVEERVGVPFRFLKVFSGMVRETGRSRRTGWSYYVRVLADQGYPDGRRLADNLRDRGATHEAALGAGMVRVARAGDLAMATEELLHDDPWATAKGPPVDVVAAERERVGGDRPAVTLPPDASMASIIGALWRLPRDIVSAGYDAALEALATQVPMTVHEYPTGMECSSWVVPERWTCRSARLETLDGRVVFSYADHPLHVVSYSLPFEGVVSQAVLREHLHTHPHDPGAIPFVFKYYERDWGLCCAGELAAQLTDPFYRVVIDTDFSADTLKVGEVIAPGSSDASVVLCAHLCHPGMVNDDLTGVAVGIEVMRALRARGQHRFTYRFLIVPETIGSIAWISRNRGLIPKLHGGLFLEMLGTTSPHALQLSFDGGAQVDRCFAGALREGDPGGWTGPFRSIIGNDERQFNAPGVRVPMLSLSRVRRRGDPQWPYPEYHSSRDTPDIISEGSLRASVDLVLAMIERLERDVTPAPRYWGELFCSRYGLHVDAYEDPEGNAALFDILALVDGTRSVSAIAEQLGVSFGAVHRVVCALAEADLVTTAGTGRTQ
jgi:aminopeptidase-like protein/aminoglycoside N3'-acetyltransferase